jgi:hypothetical protein
VLAVAERRRLMWHAQRRTGAVFHMLGSIEPLGRAGETAIAENAEAADALYQSVKAALTRAGRDRASS